MNSDCVCAKCCAALLPYFSVGKLEFSVLNYTSDSSIKDISFDEYFTSKLSNCATQMCKKDFFLVQFNAQSLPKNKYKVDEVLNDMKRLLDVIAILETKLHANGVSNVHISNITNHCTLILILMQVEFVLALRTLSSFIYVTTCC